ncbi:MAG TPA: hypothetical protein VFP96_00155 [Candidatus Acidoferrum sp.]|nr:hypothetical protein [Candidatus Acidoferrum sp.]
MSKAQDSIQIAILAVVSIVTVWMFYEVPSWQRQAAPFLFGTVGAGFTVVCLWLTRRLGSRAMKFERGLLTAFLVGMPLIYMAGWFVGRSHGGNSWIWTELAGFALFAGFGALGVKKSAWFLATGIAAHGLVWDIWHYRNSAYIPDWYAVACMLVDIALGVYVAARIPTYKEAERSAEGN